MPLNSSDISKHQKTAACDWSPRLQRFLDKSRFKGEKLNWSRTYQRQKTAALDSSQTAAAFLDSCLNGDNQTHEYI
jgi:hypothetical protein